jgi:mono/diheme cytochrome c family protein
VIGRYMFVNEIRVAPAGRQATGGPGSVDGDDRFSLAAVRRAGVLNATLWTRLPTSPGTTDPLRRLEAEGREVFRLACAKCHTVDGYLAIRPLVSGRSREALTAIVGHLTTADREPAGASAMWTWRGRRMPPFPGTEAERDALAAYLTSLPAAARTNGGDR